MTMGQVNANWPRWIFASVSKHFDARRQGLNLFIEGQHRDTSDAGAYIELRIDGPEFREDSKGYWRVFSEINVLVSTPLDDTNFHLHQVNIGIVAAAFTTINIYKYGTGVLDDQSLLGCYQLVHDYIGRERLIVSNFGQIDPAVKLLQATVEGHYEMFLSE